MSLSILARHEGHDAASGSGSGHSGSHYANIKYGYIALILSAAALCVLAARNVLRHRVPPKFRKAVAGPVPLWVTVLGWAVVLAALCIVGVVPGKHGKLRSVAKRCGR